MTPAQRIFAIVERLRDPSPRARRWTMLIVAVVGMAYVLLTSIEQDRDFIPKFHDEYMHLLQARMLAHGKLWTAAHPLRDFFETFHVIHNERVYASIYWPGTALLYVPAVWLGLPHWVVPLLLAGASVALLYRITAELVDGVAALLAAMMLVSLSTFRLLALAAMSHGTIICLGLAVVWAYLHWRDGHKLRWAATAGALAGLAAITRPVDAIAFVLPVAVAVMIDLRALDAKRTIATVAVAAGCAAPFIALQLIENIGVTGNVLLSPYQLYAKQDSPNLEMGFPRFDPGARPHSKLPQKRLFYEVFLLPEMEKHRAGELPRTWWHDRLPLLAHVTVPNHALLALLPFSVLALHEKRRWVLWAVWPTYLLLYVPFPFLLRHYAVVPAASVIFGVVLGKRALEQLLPERFRAGAAVILTLIIIGLTAAALPEIDREVIDDGYLRPTMWFAAKEMPNRVKTPAIVLFRFGPGDDFHEEPVYNVDVVNPDDAPIIRAHHLGIERDRELFDYYAKRQPQRTVYLFDRSTRQMAELGNVADLSRRFPVTRPAGP